MKVILKQNVKGIGKAGEIKDVSDGYARNFLLPRKLAVVADARAMKDLSRLSEAEQLRADRELVEAELVRSKMQDMVLTYSVNAGEGGRLFGSVTGKDVAEALAREGVRIDRRKVHLAEPIRSLGEHSVEIRLHPQVTASLKLEIVANE